MDKKKEEKPKPVVLEVQSMKHEQATKFREGKHGEGSNKRRD